MLRFIQTGTTGIVQTFGKFSRAATPGLHFYVPFIQSITPVSNRIFGHDCQITSRTADRVFPTIDLSVQYQVLPENSQKAFFSAHNPMSRMTSFIDNAVRTEASKLTLDELYESQSDLERAVITEVGPHMESCGYTLQTVQVRDIRPPQAVLDAMNRINASARNMVAAKNEGEAEKIKKVLEAEADATRKALQGKGISDMRKAIMDGWSASISRMSKNLNMTEADVSRVILNILHIDTIGEIGRNSTHTIFIPQNYGSGSGEDITSAVRNGILQGQAVNPVNPINPVNPVNPVKTP